MTPRLKQRSIVLALAVGIVLMVTATAVATWLPMPAHANRSTQTSGFSDTGATAKAPSAPATHAMRSAPFTGVTPAGVIQAVPSPQTTTPAPTTPASTPPVRAPAAPAPAVPAPQVPTTAPGPTAGTISYTVKPGDTLSAIALWFDQHGYQALYQQNMAEIGANPNLIFPGETLTITNGVLTMSP